MAKVGYIFIATNGEEYAEDKAWMQQYGCVQVIEELSEHLEQREQSRTCSGYAERRQMKRNATERLRPMWKQLISSLERGDEPVELSPNSESV